MDSWTIDLGLCRLRAFRSEDAPSIARHANDREVWINLRDRLPHPYSLENAREWLESTLGRPVQTNFAIEVDGEAVGSVGFTPGEDVDRCSARGRLLAGTSLLGTRDRHRGCPGGHRPSHERKRI